MEEVHFSNVVTGAGACLVIAAIAYLYHNAIDVQRGKRGQLHVKINPQKWSFQSIYRAMLMIATGLFLMGGFRFLVN
jgi:hypothetical protein